MMKHQHIKDSQRYSIIHDMESCWKCRMIPIEKHEIFGGIANRQKSKDYGLVVALCHKHHEEVTLKPKCALNQRLHQVGQKKFEKIHGHEKFIEVFGKDYL